jgi:hypothetical protein
MINGIVINNLIGSFGLVAAVSSFIPNRASLRMERTNAYAECENLFGIEVDSHFGVSPLAKSCNPM